MGDLSVVKIDNRAIETINQSIDHSIHQLIIDRGFDCPIINFNQIYKYKNILVLPTR